MNGVTNTNFAPFPLHNKHDVTSTCTTNLKKIDSGLNILNTIQFMHLGKIKNTVFGVDRFRFGEG